MICDIIVLQLCLETNTRMPSGDFMKLVHELLNKNDWDIYDRQYLDECIEDLMQCNETIETDSLLFSVIMFLISVTKSENSFEIDKPVGFEVGICIYLNALLYYSDIFMV